VRGTRREVINDVKPLSARIRDGCAEIAAGNAREEVETEENRSDESRNQFAMRR
jgi:hypothetical protein